MRGLKVKRPKLSFSDTARAGWHSAAMATPPPRNTPMSGGFILAIALVVGVFVGMARGEASMGFLWGLGVGLAGLLLVWLIDRRRA